jgi:poly(3-hydroxybutyrate) depolymerase
MAGGMAGSLVSDRVYVTGMCKGGEVCTSGA